jgi:hypothetical protein
MNLSPTTFRGHREAAGHHPRRSRLPAVPAIGYCLAGFRASTHSINDIASTLPYTGWPRIASLTATANLPHHLALVLGYADTINMPNTAAVRHPPFIG